MMQSSQSALRPDGKPLQIVLTAWSSFGGIGRYAHELVRELDSQAQLVVAGRWNSAFGPKPPSARFVGLPLFRPARWHQWLTHARVRRILGRTRPDVVHSLNRSVGAFLTGTWSGTARVLTVHDLLYEQFPGSGDGLLRQDGFRSIPAESDHIISVSEATRNDLGRIYGVPKKKTSVIHLGCRPVIPDSLKAGDNFVPDPYVVFVGNRQGYKNFSGVLQALDAWPDIRSRPHLVVVGDPFHEHEMAEVQNLGLEPFTHHLGRLDDSDLAATYAGALALLYPSKHEGFGLPVLEAMSCGTAVITSNRSSLPEVAGHAALLVDPENPASIRDALLRLVREPALREDLVARGLDRVSRFRWADTAAATLRVYQRLAVGQSAAAHDHVVTA